MPQAGFYPRGGGVLDAWIEPAELRAITLTDRGPLLRIRGTAGVARLDSRIAERMRTRAAKQLAAHGFEAEIELVEWPSPPQVQGAAIALTAELTAASPATFVGLGERGKPAEQVADEAVEELLAFLSAPGGAVDLHSADQILLPLALAPGRSEITVTAVTEHLLTNAATIAAFLDRAITIEKPTDERPGRVVVA
jgi:RNA 3'-terminal phosphate cyclase (ATP)